MSTARTSPSKARKKSASKARSPRRKTAEAVAAPVAAEAPKPAGTLSPNVRQEMILRRSVLAVAIQRVEPGSKSGNPNKCWSMPRDTLVAMADAYVVETKSRAFIRDRFAAELAEADIAVRTLDRWLADIRASFNTVYAREVAKRTTLERAAFASGDAVALMGFAFAELAPLHIEAGRNQLAENPSPKEIYANLRFLELMTTAAKVQSEARFKEVQTDKLLAVINTVKKAAGDTSRDPREALSVISNAIGDLMLGGSPGEAA